MATGTTTINFGAFPGASDASVTVTGQTAILAGSLVEAWVFPANTADHSSDEHWLETIKVVAGNVVAGVGFTIYAMNTNQISEKENPLDDLGRFSGAGAATGRGRQDNDVDDGVGAGKGTRLYGVWNVAWAGDY